MASLFPWMEEKAEARPAVAPAPPTQPTDLAARARRLAQQELDALREKPEKPMRDTLLKGFGRF